ncbi:MAG TPA: sulfotransferase [Steroidobacter sp.]|jgi:hypothetical protein|nr:sulfotransferase [Steroidobacteraceae bacterium]HLS81222.1 sulfotransferase [Steroidobacter sp.]
MLFYFDFAAWLKLIRLASAVPSERQRRGLRRLLLLTIPLRALTHSICFFLDGVLFPGLWRVKVKAPIFVIGHARSGTTLAHRLMCMDQRMSAFKYWELRLPSLLEKKIVHALAWLDSHVFGRRIERRLAAWEERKFGAVKQIHKMGLNVPEEDDLIFYDSCASGFWMTKLPFMGDLDFFHLDRRAPRSRKRLMRFYRECVRRQLYLNGGEKIHLSKNPTWCGRVESLLEIFPDARFVILYRNPYETIPSLLKLLHVSWKHAGNIDAAKIAESTRAMTDLSYEHYLYPLEALARRPETPVASIDYRELISDPKGAIERAYVEIGLEMTDQFRAALQREQERARRHETEHRYSLAEFGLDDREIRTRLGSLFERFGWDADAPSSKPEERTHA